MEPMVLLGITTQLWRLVQCLMMRTALCIYRHAWTCCRCSCKWLPFNLDHYQYCKVDDEHGVLALDPSIPRAAGPTNMDGSPDMAHIKNARVAEMLGLKSLSVHASVGEGTCKALNDRGSYTESNTKPHSNTYRRRPASSSHSSRPPLSSEASENIFIAEQMRAVAAPFATKLAWILAVLVVALLHEKIECALMITLLFMHAVFYWLQITIGSHGGVDYRMDYRNVLAV